MSGMNNGGLDPNEQEIARLMAEEDEREIARIMAEEANAIDA